MGIAAAHGRAAEALAVAYLELVGFRVVARNARLAGVEVDVVAQDRDAHVVVEVKYRSRSDYGGAAAAIDRGKRERLRRAASSLVARGHSVVRIDVVTVELGPEGADVRHHRGVASDG